MRFSHELINFLVSSSITSSEPLHQANFESQSTLKEPQFSTLKASVYVRNKEESEDSQASLAEENTENSFIHQNENER